MENLTNEEKIAKIDSEVNIWNLQKQFLEAHKKAEIAQLDANIKTATEIKENLIK